MAAADGVRLSREERSKLNKMKLRIGTVRMKEFPSSSGSRVYVTREMSDGKLQCNCRGWTQRTPPQGRECRHTRMLRDFRPVQVVGGCQYIIAGKREEVSND